ncbi:M15 family metallopeptidase [Desulfovibrio aminophilus]|uniref:M15 family metallopeptidase n=1 Tax=Desulfovibrio aminophilus TaxID=81425 RepID=UPI003392953B
MLRDREGRKLWIQTERGEFDPLESYQQIDERRKSQSGPDWWVVAKEPDWAPPKRRMSLVAGGLGGHTKPNSHGDQQPYDELGRYAGPGEGAWSEKPKEETARGGSLPPPFGGLQKSQEALAFLETGEAGRGKARLENTPELPDWPSGLDVPGWPGEMPALGRLQPVKLRGLKKNTLLDVEFTERLRRFEELNRQDGISVIYTQGFRTTNKQKEIKDKPNENPVATPGNSLHEAGRAVDISWDKLTPTERVRVVQNAKKVGIAWGGDFKTQKDNVHFYREVPNPGNDRSEFIKRAQEAYEKPPR